jgi:hypothetical protein
MNLRKTAGKQGANGPLNTLAGLPLMMAMQVSVSSIHFIATVRDDQC